MYYCVVLRSNGCLNYNSFVVSVVVFAGKRAYCTQCLSLKQQQQKKKKKEDNKRNKNTL